MEKLPDTNQRPASAPPVGAPSAPRRTFAIISHPDAGKTTLTEKMLLYGNAIEVAGNVRARKNQRTTTSDWMAMERERGISISSTVLQFPYRGYVVNLLDTPGHQDFSEDTYRTLAAVDSAVMVLDAAKGIEPQTRKLFDVCRLRGIPIFTFINKMDRPARHPLELLDEIQTILGMEPIPMNWPIGDGSTFLGVYDREAQGAILFEKTERNEREALEKVVSLSELRQMEAMTEKRFAQLEEDVQLLDSLNIVFDHQRVLNEEQTPVYFGSALTNFGVRQFLDGFVDSAPPPQPFPTKSGSVAPDDPGFAGFVFKIQANMDPKHRDSVAFVRVCSGQFERDMSAVHAQSGKTVRLARPYRLFGGEREIVDRAYPGDIVGIPNNAGFAIGDTLYTETSIEFAPIARFSPEHFATLRNKDIAKRKQFDKGVQQLESEGAIQVLFDIHAFAREPILAAVGPLQFEVVQSRLENEYGVVTILERLPHVLARWVSGPEDRMNALPNRQEVMLTRDIHGLLVAVFSSPFYLTYYTEQYPDLVFLDIATTESSQ
ncbi:MAG: peptide chain release factor 3 [Anaerolineae bacterium]|nr:MAG: peptide chain release factor 3 [Anaerolineae bacterium]